MKPWHYSRIRFLTRVHSGTIEGAPVQAPNGDWVFFWVEVRNSDPTSAFRCTQYACGTLGQ